mmetsp:Transcript_44011/g.128159  ORF Transcript_44011/g.128159 Transcript_44011/m.128159 type:complete len:218 (+) Transcript_44011:2592-3245(+)
MSTESVGICRTVPEGKGCICADRARATMRRRASRFVGSEFRKRNTSMGSSNRGTLPWRAAATDSKHNAWCSLSVRRSRSRSSLAIVPQTSTKDSSSRSDIWFHHWKAFNGFMSLGRERGTCSTRVHIVFGVRVRPTPRRYQISLKPPRWRTPRMAPTMAVTMLEKNGREAEKHSQVGTTKSTSCAITNIHSEVGICVVPPCISQSPWIDFPHNRRTM